MYKTRGRDKVALEKALEAQKKINRDLEERVKKQDEEIRGKDLKIKKLQATLSLGIRRLKELKEKVDQSIGESSGGNLAKRLKVDGNKVPLDAVKHENVNDSDERSGLAELKFDLSRVKLENEEEENEAVDDYQEVD